MGICAASYQLANTGQSGMRPQTGGPDERAPMSAPSWRPDRLATRRGNLTARSCVLTAVRGFFAERGYA